MRPALAVAVLLGSVCAVAQVSVREPATQAKLVDGHTTISLAVSNGASKPVEARVRLRWLSPAGKVDGETQRTVTLAPGNSAVAIPHPFPATSNALAERLEYSLASTERNYTAFAPLAGILQFSHIASYTFTTTVITVGIPRPGKRFEVRVLTVHPVTGLPVAGVKVKVDDPNADDVTAVTDQYGVALLRVKREPGDDGSIDIDAEIGDVKESAGSTALPNAQDVVHGYTDKPIYQPGQTMHIRILAVGSDGKSKANEQYELRVVDGTGELVYGAKVDTSRFGVAATDWVIPESAEAGQYAIRLRTEDGEPVLRRVDVRAYELPSFRVTATAGRSFYLVDQKAVVEIRGAYLFGKPVTGARVRIVAANDETKDVATGRLDGEGRFRVELATHIEFNSWTKFEDQHYIAFLTDESTNRTEQRKFDIRISQDPVHVYAARMQNDGGGRRIYVTTYLPDGTPLQSDVEVASGSVVLGRGKTNRFGVARIDLTGNPDEKKVEIRAVAEEWNQGVPRGLAHEGIGAASPLQERMVGLRGHLEVEFAERKSGAWLTTDRTLYRAGEAVRCTVGSARPEASVIVIASNDKDEVLFTKHLRLTGGSVQVAIPYDHRFGRAVNIGVATGGERDAASRRVYFPGPGDLSVKATPVKGTYRPGETASVQLQASAVAALGIAVVDQSVLERAATDSAFGNRSWFDSEWQGQSLGGITERDLLNVTPAKIDDELQLVAEVLSGDAGPFLVQADDTLEDLKYSLMNSAAQALKPVQDALDQHYLRTLEYPRDDVALARITDQFGRAQDPWNQPYFTRYSIQRENAVLEIVSAGPDKVRGTADDFTALKVERDWFVQQASLIRSALKDATDYPPTAEGFLQVLEGAGIKFEALRDPWGGALRAEVSHQQVWRDAKILSGGPDRQFGTADDFVVATFRGSYFSAMEKEIDWILNAAPEFPATEGELRSLLMKSGVDLDSLRDPWGHGYYVTLRDEQFSASQLRLYTYAEYGSPSEDRKESTPVKKTVRSVEIRSLGADGRKETYDDFAVATFLHVIRAPEAAAEVTRSFASLPAVTVGGTGNVVGTVTDPSGAVVPKAEVKLNDIYSTRTSDDGKFLFAGVPPGKYQLRSQAPGFRVNVIEGVPVVAGHVTRADMVLSIGQIEESVEVQAEVQTIQTSSSSVAMAASVALSTPRVREYFPETLYWTPELVTDSRGRALLKVKLADSVTTWHVAVIGSTEDGRITETSTDIRAFQPFLVDLDLPPVLTAGDEIALPVPVRNYTETAQKVAVTAKVPSGWKLVEAVRQPAEVGPSSSANALLTVRAGAAANGARVQVMAVGGTASDAMEKPVNVHPDGERRVLAVNAAVENGQAVRLVIGPQALPGSVRGAVKVYPSLLARILESIAVLLEKPHGCGEQTISSTYPNLLLLTTLKEAGLEDGTLQARAMQYLSLGYQRLLGYQDASGGFTYWGHGDTDVALTAYALTFLDDARAFLAVDEERVLKAREWLAQQKATEPATDALRMRALARTLTGESPAEQVDAVLGSLARSAADVNDAYAVAAYALAAMEAQKPELAEPMIARLTQLAVEERGTAFWAPQSNTPYYGWGRWGRVETTALAVTALARWRKLGHNDGVLNSLIDRGGLFLIEGADAGGAWGTSQSTVRALMALLESWGHDVSEKAVAIDVRVNGVGAGRIAVPAGHVVGGPVLLDVSRLLKAGSNEITLTGLESRLQQVQAQATWYAAWGEKRKAKSLDLEVKYSALTAAVNEAVSCDVVISRSEFRGYGMMIAQVGLPPGAEVDRSVLDGLLKDGRSGVDSYEVAPDHVTFYVWPNRADLKFRFVFRPRYAIKARAAESVLYDYYNPDERAVLTPPRFVVRAASAAK